MPDNDQRLYKAFEAKYRSGPAEIVMTLLHTFGDKERGDPLTYETLIAYLKHDRVGIREQRVPDYCAAHNNWENC